MRTTPPPPPAFRMFSVTQQRHTTRLKSDVRQKPSKMCSLPERISLSCHSFLRQVIQEVLSLWSAVSCSLASLGLAPCSSWLLTVQRDSIRLPSSIMPASGTGWVTQAVRVPQVQTPVLLKKKIKFRNSCFQTEGDSAPIYLVWRLNPDPGLRWTGFKFYHHLLLAVWTW
jgi:hypothetical protein